VGGAVAGAAGAFGKAKELGGKAKELGGDVASGAAKTVFGGAGMLSQAGAASKAVKELGGGKADQAAAFMGSIGSSVKETALAKGGDLARSLLGHNGHSGSSGGDGSGAGVNRHDKLQQHLAATNGDNQRQTAGEYLKERKQAGTERGLEHMARKEARQNSQNQKKPAASGGGVENQAARQMEKQMGMENRMGNLKPPPDK
jgi:hypothetical protein